MFTLFQILNSGEKGDYFYFILFVLHDIISSFYLLNNIFLENALSFLNSNQSRNYKGTDITIPIFKRKKNGGYCKSCGWGGKNGIMVTGCFDKI